MVVRKYLECDFCGRNTYEHRGTNFRSKRYSLLDYAAKDKVYKGYVVSQGLDFCSDNCESQWKKLFKRENPFRTKEDYYKSIGLDVW